jgi:hypothetical protein
MRKSGRVAATSTALVCLAAAVLVAVLPIAASALLRDLLRSSPSDPRATMVVGNVVTCAGAGFGGSTQMGSPTNASASDANVAGTVKTNAGSVQQGKGQEVDVAITGAGVVVDAVIVKGGPAYNVYSNAAVLPPALAPDQHYISPLNGGSNVPTISHWFVCYHLSTPPPVGSLTVTKIVIAPNGEPATPLPTSYSSIVNCNDGIPAHTNATVTFPGGGGEGTPVLTGITNGSVCTVVEQNTGAFPSGTSVSYSPAGADSTGVTISGSAAAQVAITNDFSAVAVQKGTVQLVKVLAPNPGNIPIPATFTTEVACDDGTDTTVTLPGGGGPGSPAVTPAIGSLCVLQESTEVLPPGWVVTYSVDGGPASLTLPKFPIPSSTPVTVTILNDPSQVAAEVVTQPAAQPVAVQPSFTG